MKVGNEKTMILIDGIGVDEKIFLFPFTPDEYEKICIR